MKRGLMTDPFLRPPLSPSNSNIRIEAEQAESPPNPRLLDYVCAVNGYPPPDTRSGFTWGEMDCGNGFPLLILAAANPSGQFYGLSFHPGRTDDAEELRTAAGVNNLLFTTISPAELSKPDMPPCDYLLMPGASPFPGPDARRQVLACAERLLKPGGTVLTSYRTPHTALLMEPVLHFLRVAGAAPNSTHRSVVAAANRDHNVLRTAGDNSLTLGDRKGSAFAALSTAAGNRLDLKDAGDAGDGVLPKDPDGKGVVMKTASGHQYLQMKDEGEQGELILAAATPLQAFGVAAPEVPIVQEDISKFRIGRAVHGIDMTTNETVNRISSLADNSISLGNHSALSMGIMNSFALAADMGVTAGPHGRKYLWGGSEFSARKLSRFCRQEYFNVSNDCIIGANAGVYLGGGMLPPQAASYSALANVFFLSVAATAASTAAGCTAATLHAPAEARMGIAGGSLALALIMAKVQDRYFETVKYAPTNQSYMSSLILGREGAWMSVNPTGGFLNLQLTGGILASDLLMAAAVNVSKAGIAASGPAIDIKAATVAGLQGGTGVVVKSPGLFVVQGGAGQVKAGASNLTLTPAIVQLAGGIVKIG